MALSSRSRTAFFEGLLVAPFFRGQLGGAGPGLLRLCLAAPRHQADVLAGHPRRQRVGQGRTGRLLVRGLNLIAIGLDL